MDFTSQNTCQKVTPFSYYACQCMLAECHPVDKCGTLLKRTDLNKRGRLMMRSCAARMGIMKGKKRITVEAKVHVEHSRQLPCVFLLYIHVHFPVYYLTDRLKILPERGG